MTFWIISLLMVAVAVLCVLLPLARKPRQKNQSENSLDVYVAQLADIERKIEMEEGDRDALELERAEVSRRVLKQARSGDTSLAAGPPSKFNRVAASLMALVLVPGLSLALYSAVGSPNLVDQPLGAQAGQSLESRSIEEMVLMAERHLAKNPDDAKGWNVLADVYGRTNRPTDRARALQELIRVSGPSAELLTDLGEALTVAQGNIVTARARQLFEQALSLQPGAAKASFYLAFALEQEGKDGEALERWTRLAKVRQDDPRWQAMTTQKVSELREKLGLPAERPTGAAPPNVAPGPTAEDIANAAGMSATDRGEMINSMVEGLAMKLQDNPNDLAGWTRLIRAYVVLGRDKDAEVALTTARKAFADQPESLSRLDQQAQEMGLTRYLGTEDRQ